MRLCLLKTLKKGENIKGDSFEGYSIKRIKRGSVNARYYVQIATERFIEKRINFKR